MHHNEVKKRTQTPDMDKQHKGESYDFFFFSKEEVLVSQEKKNSGMESICSAHINL